MTNPTRSSKTTKEAAANVIKSNADSEDYAAVLAFPKPKYVSRPPRLGIFTLEGGAERCNLLTAEGREEYERRKRSMWLRQNYICCLKGHINSCPGQLTWGDSTFDHEIPRGMGSAFRDDRIEVEVQQKDGTWKTLWQNGAAHARCNSLKGSRRIKYNAAHNGTEDQLGSKINFNAIQDAHHGLQERPSMDTRKHPVAHPLRSGDPRKTKGA